MNSLYTGTSIATSTNSIPFELNQHDLLSEEDEDEDHFLRDFEIIPEVEVTHL
jgi:hypothetical protein